MAHRFQDRTGKESQKSMFNVKEIKSVLDSRSDPGPIKSVCMQEIDRYNMLLKQLHKSLKNLDLGIQGLVAITPAPETVFNALLVGQVPEVWGFCYPSMKPLAAWMTDIQARCEQMSK